MSERARVRRARVTDAPALARLMDILGYPTATTEMRRRLPKLLGRPDRATFVAVTERRVVGMIGVQIGAAYERDGLWGRLAALVVAPDVQRRGIGRKLLWHAERWLRAKGAAGVTVTSNQARLSAHRFYETYGYENTGYRFVKALKRGAQIRAELPRRRT